MNNNKTRFLQFLRLLRPHQWIKNSFVFAGLIFAHAWHNGFLVRQAIVTAIAFSLTASAVYVFNDICDRKLDLTHTKRKTRVLAGGFINTQTALLLAAILATIGLILGFLVAQNVGLILIIYIILNIAYSLLLKRIIIVDVIIIATGFLLRVLAGTIGIGIPPSHWILICTFMLTLFLGFSKRRSELRYIGKTLVGPVKTLQGYSKNLLDSLLILTAAAAIISYGFYAFHQNKLYTVLFVAIGISRYSYLLVMGKNNGLDIAHDLFYDRILLFTVLFWLAGVLVVSDT